MNPNTPEAGWSRKDDGRGNVFPLERRNDNFLVTSYGGLRKNGFGLWVGVGGGGCGGWP
jgi:hypothetical protein